MAKPLYKFSSAEGATAILRFNSMFVTSPLDLNDPFEMRPAWTKAHELRFHANQVRHKQFTAGMPLFVCTEEGPVNTGQLMPAVQADPPLDVEQQRGISDEHNRGVFEQMHGKFRILSLVADLMDDNGDESRHEKATLMWAHYADQFQGVCIAVDPDEFYNGIKSHGYEVNYDAVRRFLPPEYYDTYLRVAAAQPRKKGNVIDPSTGFELPPALQTAWDQQRLIDILTHKSPAWKYEHEVRMIYDLPELKRSSHHRDVQQTCRQCRILEKPLDACENRQHRDAVTIPEKAIRAVIFGNDCQGTAAADILDILADERYAHVELFWCSLHSDKYVVQYNKRDSEYIRFIQKHRAEEIASAKGHIRHSESGLEVKTSPKGVNYPDFGQST